VEAITTNWQVAALIPREAAGLFNRLNPWSHTTALGWTQPVIKMSTMTLPGSKGWLAHKADNLNANCELTVWKMWEHRCLTTLWASATCYMDSVIFFFSFLFFYSGTWQCSSWCP
jgi:hypothetical protein